ncbi:hypothetical protein Catovirus_2_272 [Catovirus CTV1]|uniref:Uncharacterized protein n=1 Tax=Catovirus CTV1 TaxID=1977631 RepID=A0A1V0SC83_9VIRU|nr:hypothetical protein Catovirus_2_272 [Catovirus CTV1]
MNIVKKNGNILRFESYWRNNQNDKSYVDSNGKLFPFPKEERNWTDKKQFLNRLIRICKLLKNNKKFKHKKNKDCLLCDKKNITEGEFNLNNVIWEDGLIHYIDVHNTKPSEEFIELIYNFQHDDTKSNVLNVNGTMYKIKDLKYLKLDRNQIMIMDALMSHGGYTKKYIDSKNKNIYRYSEHAGLIDFNENTVDKIIISGRTNRVDEGDEEIYLPKNMPDAFDYEYIFHTHPPTPKPGGRANIGILYEFPSISDIFHFIDHYNEGETQGSLVIAAEGLYNIRTNSLDKSKIKINEDLMYKSLTKLMQNLQSDAIEKYGIEFSTQFFHSKIAQDFTFINGINKLLEKHNLHIDFFPRIKDEFGNWIIDTIYLPIYVIEPIR